MTIPYERTRAVLQTRDLLKELAIGRSSVHPDTLRRRAEALLRHFPEPFHIDISAAAAPTIWAHSNAQWKCAPLWQMHRQTGRTDES